jgi:hypothetical protein
MLGSTRPKDTTKKKMTASCTAPETPRNKPCKSSRHPCHTLPQCCSFKQRTAPHTWPLMGTHTSCCPFPTKPRRTGVTTNPILHRDACCQLLLPGLAVSCLPSPSPRRTGPTIHPCVHLLLPAPAARSYCLLLLLQLHVRCNTSNVALDGHPIAVANNVPAAQQDRTGRQQDRAAAGQGGSRTGQQQDRTGCESLSRHSRRQTCWLPELLELL